MEFDDLCIEEAKIIGHLAATQKDIRYLLKLRKGRSNFMENV
jgi:hypothetical protein